MALPPGREPIPVAGISATTNPRMAKASAELAAWIDYLLHPESNDGPRIYRPKHPGHPDTPDVKDFECAYRMPPADRDAPYEDPDKYETLSVLKDFADDTSVFFKAAQAVSGIRSELIGPTYDKLTKGCLTWYDPNTAKAPDAEDDHRDVDHAKYPVMHPALGNWDQMRKTWEAVEDHSAYAYEVDFVNFQLHTENAFYIVAEYLVRYRGILHKAGEDILALTEAFVELCPRPAPEGNASFNLMSVLITGLVAAATTVISGGSGTTVGVVLGVAVTEMLGEGIKTAEAPVPEHELKLDNQRYLADVARTYLKEVNQIEQDTADALDTLANNLRGRMDRLRQGRGYEVKPTSGTMSTKVPYFRDYLPQ